MDPPGPPPSYEEASGSSGQPSRPSTHLEVPHKTRSGIPPESRRSMEDENRELPHGWVRQYDAKQRHQFFVDTKANSPRSIWHHPYDDDQYMNNISSEERTHIQGLHRVPTQADIEAESSGDDHDGAHHPELPPRTTNENIGGAHKFGRKMKDKLTNSTHEERERKRRQREAEEQKAYEQHQRFRTAMSKAVETGIPQFLGRDRDGKDVYIEGPYGPGGPATGYGQGSYGYNPYTQGPYANPNAKFVRPPDPYARPYGYGYGGGYGLPLFGLGGGLLLGGLLI